MHATEPLLRPTRISELRPTQMTVGLREVERKRREWRDHAGEGGSDYLGAAHDSGRDRAETATVDDR
jgi:hypothetical protein